LGEG
jgi:hypothetical protein